MKTPRELCLDTRRLCKDWGVGAATLVSPITTTSDRIIVVDWPEDLGEGVYAEIGIELLQLVTVGASMQVRRGCLGTTPAEAATGELVVFQPRFTNQAIMDALNRALSTLSAKRPLIVQREDSSLVVSDTTDEYELTPASGEGEYLSIERVEIKIGYSDVYREITDWEEIKVPGGLVLHLLGNHASGRQMRVTLAQEYQPMIYTGDAPSGLRRLYERFLVEFAAGTLLEYDDIYGADWARQVPGQPDLRGRQQAIGRQYQLGALSLLEAIDPSSGRMVRKSDLRNYRL